MMKQTVRRLFGGVAVAVGACALSIAVSGAQAQENPASTAQKSVDSGMIRNPTVNLGGSTYWTADAQPISDNNYLAIVSTLFNPADETLGATLVPISDVLRAQLNVAAGQGVLVESLRGDGPSALAGLKQYDVLLTLADKPLASADDLSKHLKEAGESPVPLKLLRSGKKKTIQVRPIYRVTLGPVSEVKKEYFIGISLSSLDEALRSQLRLSAGQGVLITDVVKDSPAEKAGVKSNDIVLEFGSKPVESPDKLAAEVQADQDKPATLKILRAGQPLSIAVTPAVRDVKGEAAELINRSTVRLLGIQDREGAKRATYTRELQNQYRLTLADRELELRSSKQIEELRNQVQSLQQAVEKLNATLNNTPNIPPKK
jgi:membrane-associated protease RseP (regulator of RpoE activity)